MKPVEAIKTNPFILAPMAGITDHAFRTFMKKLDTSVVVTELVSANGAQFEWGGRASDALVKRRCTPIETP